MGSYMGSRLCLVASAHSQRKTRSCEPVQVKLPGMYTLSHPQFIQDAGPALIRIVAGVTIDRRLLESCTWTEAVSAHFMGSKYETGVRGVPNTALPKICSLVNSSSDCLLRLTDFNASGKICLVTQIPAKPQTKTQRVPETAKPFLLSRVRLTVQKRRSDSLRLPVEFERQ